MVGHEEHVVNDLLLHFFSAALVIPVNLDSSCWVVHFVSAARAISRLRPATVLRPRMDVSCDVPSLAFDLRPCCDPGWMSLASNRLVHSDSLVQAVSVSDAVERGGRHT